VVEGQPERGVGEQADAATADPFPWFVLCLMSSVTLMGMLGNPMNILDNGIHLAHIMSYEELDRVLDLITYNGAKTLNVEDQYGLEPGKPANFLVLDAPSAFEAVRKRADVLASIRMVSIFSKSQSRVLR
jgi:hypothetical protein